MFDSMAQAHRPTGTNSCTRSPGTDPATRRDRLLRLGAPSAAATGLTATVALAAFTFLVVHLSGVRRPGAERT